jgi:hypothetical protein
MLVILLAPQVDKAGHMQVRNRGLRLPQFCLLEGVVEHGQWCMVCVLDLCALLLRAQQLLCLICFFVSFVLRILPG